MIVGGDLGDCYWGLSVEVEDVGLSVTLEGDTSGTEGLVRDGSRR